MGSAHRTSATGAKYDQLDSTRGNCKAVVVVGLGQPAAVEMAELNLAEACWVEAHVCCDSGRKKTSS